MSATVPKSNLPQPTSENILHIFPDVQPLDVSANKALASATRTGDPPPSQDALMEEMCIVVDEEDREIGMASKRVCHQLANINRGLLHRAFSVLLFDTQNRLLIHQRASHKITLPNQWTNTCCSHPLAVATETGGIAGFRRAAQRKLQHELGITSDDVALGSLHFATRMHYRCLSDARWGEHEIASVFLCKADVSLDVNADEIRDYRYVTRSELQRMLGDSQFTFTPWFRLYCENFLDGWWEAICADSLPDLKADCTIHRL